MLLTTMKVKFKNDDFDFYRSGVMVLERLKNISKFVYVLGLDM